MWLFAAATKLAAPLAPYELLAHVVPPGAPSRMALAAAVGAETILGAAMILRVVRGFAASLAALAVATAVLVAVRTSAPDLVPCGCFGDVLGTTLDGALWRNAVLAAVHVALILWRRAASAA
jgi:hypothetical protein